MLLLSLYTGHSKEYSVYLNMKMKEKLIEKILHIDDESVLEDIMEMVDLELELVGDTVTLTDEQKDFIDEGIKEMQSGKLLSNEEAQRQTKVWFKNK